MLRGKGEMLSHAWIAGDAEMGRSTRFRASLRRLRERYLLAVPCDTNIRDLDGEVPEGKRKRPFERVDKWIASLSNEAWTRVDVRDGEKGPIVVEAAKTRVRAKTEEQRIGPEELLFVTRTAEAEGKLDYDYYLSDAPPETPLEELARVAKAENRIEEAIKRAKSEAGLSEYQVRSWPGWHHHQTLSLMASWFLTLEARRGKRGGARDDGPAGGEGLGDAAA